MTSLLHETSEAYAGNRTSSAMSAPSSSARSASPTINGMQEKEKSNVDIEAKAQLSERQALSSPEDFPEGGLRAWSVVWGGFFAFIATFGVTNSYVGSLSCLLSLVFTSIFVRVFSKITTKRRYYPIPHHQPSPWSARFNCSFSMEVVLSSDEYTMHMGLA